MVDKIKTQEQLEKALNKLFKTELLDLKYTFNVLLPIGKKDLRVAYYASKPPEYCLEQLTFDYDYWDEHGEFPQEELFNTQDPQEMYNEILKRKEAQDDK